MINIEEKLDVISWLEKDEWIVDICHNARYACSSIYTICENADKITENAISGSKVFITKTTTVPSEWMVLKTMDVNSLYLYGIRNKYIVWKCMYTLLKFIYAVYVACMYSAGPYIR
jgi:hypothetical protein